MDRARLLAHGYAHLYTCSTFHVSQPFFSLMTRYTKLEGRRALPADTVREEDTDDVPRTEAQNETIADPRKLLKRAKLMRLKAKKTNSPEHRATFSKRVRELESEAARMNGKRGTLGKRSRDEHGDRSAFRRYKRAVERNSEMMCYVCREMGHSAKDCKQDTGANGLAVGICFRCGSTEHNLSKCPKPATDALPYATCYVCSNIGHLASRCPKNRGRGIYPDGGDCKICHSVEHLARDCPSARERTASHERPQRVAAPSPPPKKVVSFN